MRTEIAETRLYVHTSASRADTSRLLACHSMGPPASWYAADSKQYEAIQPAPPVFMRFDRFNACPTGVLLIEETKPKKIIDGELYYITCGHLWVI